MARKEIIRSQEEIEEVIDWCIESKDLPNSTHYRGMTYEDGLRGMYEWLVGETDDKPNE